MRQRGPYGCGIILAAWINTMIPNIAPIQPLGSAAGLDVRAGLDRGESLGKNALIIAHNRQTAVAL